MLSERQRFWVNRFGYNRMALSFVVVVVVVATVGGAFLPVLLTPTFITNSASPSSLSVLVSLSSPPPSSSSSSPYSSPPSPLLFFLPQSGAADAEIKSLLVRTQSLNVLPLKPGVGQYIAIHATLTASDFFLAYVYSSGLFTCIFPNLSRLLLFWQWLTQGSCVVPQSKKGHPAG